MCVENGLTSQRDAIAGELKTVFASDRDGRHGPARIVGCNERKRIAPVFAADSVPRDRPFPPPIACRHSAQFAAAHCALRAAFGGIGGTAANAIVGGLASVAGGGKFENGAVTAAFGYMFNSMLHSYNAVAFNDDQGNPVKDPFGYQMMMPSDANPHFFVDKGLAAAFADALSGTPGQSFENLLNFRQGQAWDIQRVGSDHDPTQAFVDFATVAIGLYGAAAGISGERGARN